MRARDQTASVIAVISRPEQADYVRALGADEVVITSKDDLTVDDREPPPL
jgi:NADPH:quinone reductase-like Zn-dependent oxidoreductase